MDFCCLLDTKLELDEDFGEVEELEVELVVELEWDCGVELESAFKLEEEICAL